VLRTLRKRCDSGHFLAFEVVQVILLDSQLARSRPAGDFSMAHF
jgi:hypothetical protein